MLRKCVCSLTGITRTFHRVLLPLPAPSSLCWDESTAREKGVALFETFSNGRCLISTRTCLRELLILAALTGLRENKHFSSQAEGEDEL